MEVMAPERVKALKGLAAGANPSVSPTGEGASRRSSQPSTHKDHGRLHRTGGFHAPHDGRESFMLRRPTCVFSKAREGEESPSEYGPESDLWPLGRRRPSFGAVGGSKWFEREKCIQTRHVIC